jgi:hypothetical protein
MMNGPQLPHYWKDSVNWRIRDFEMMGEIVNAAQERMGTRLRQYRGGGMGMPGFGHGDPLMGNDFFRPTEPGGGMRPRGSALGWNGGSDDSPILQHIGAIASEHDRRINQMRDFMGISDDAMRERAYRQRQQELWEGISRMDRDFMGPGIGDPMLGRNPIGHQGGRRRWPPNYGDDYYNEGPY